MALPAQKFREVVFQLLYSQDIGRAADDSMIELLSDELAVTKSSVRIALDRVHQIVAHQDEIDAMIAKTSKSYNFERIQSVERNVLRIGVFELLFEKTTPPKVSISEAMRLARKFSTKESAAFVNAILDALFKASLGQPVDKASLEQSAEELARVEKISHEASQNTQDMQKSTDEDIQEDDK